MFLCTTCLIIYMFCSSVCIVRGYCTNCMLITAKLRWAGPDSRQVPMLVQALSEVKIEMLKNHDL